MRGLRLISLYAEGNVLGEHPAGVGKADGRVEVNKKE